MAEDLGFQPDTEDLGFVTDQPAEQPGIASRALNAVGRGLADIPSTAWGGIKSLGRGAVTAGQILSGDPTLWMGGTDPMEALKGVGQGLSMGLYSPPQPTVQGSQDLRNLGQQVGGAIPFVTGLEGLKALGVGAKAGIPIVSSLMNAIQGGSQGGWEGAVQGATTGAGVAGLSEALGATGKKGLQYVERPYARNVIEPAADYATTEATKLEKFQQTRGRQLDQYQIDEDAARKAYDTEQGKILAANRNKILNAQLWEAQRADQDLKNAQTLEQHRELISRRDSARATLDKILGKGGEAGTLPETLKAIGSPSMTPQEAYAAYNLAKANPETLPRIPLTASTDILKSVGGGLAASTEGLPKAAGPTGLTEKLAVGLGSELPSEAGQPIHPKVKDYFGPSINAVKAATLKTISDSFYKQEALGQVAKGIGLDHGALNDMAQGTLRLDQADRLLQVLGKASNNSRVAGKIFWGLVSDLESAAKDNPEVQSLLNARGVYRQTVAINDLTEMAAPTSGRTQPNLAAIRAVFNSSKRSDMLLAKSFPEATRKTLIDTLARTWQIREEATKVIRKPTVQSIPVAKPFTLKEPLPPYKPGEVPVTPIPKPGEAPTEAFRPKFPEQGQMLDQLAQGKWAISPAILTTLAHFAGMPISWGGAIFSLALATKIAPMIAFKLTMLAARSQAGRNFLEQLYKGEAPSGLNTTKLMALGNFVQSQQQKEP